ncbi:SDR family oxidoreductase [Marinibacterium sp. SX1]|uniref:SDR family oxidoreductase n=1 Tax=Marinibacterium sp. SX1 TaxID=3388424 RepID=UPI003D162965
MTKTILITGASRGIGRLTARLLAEQGHVVHAGLRHIDGRNAEAAAELAGLSADLPGQILPVSLDVTDADQIATAVAGIEATGPIDVLINNAGVMPVGVTEAFTIAQAQATMDVNLYGIMRTTRAVLPAMRARKSGLIISLSSAAGRFGMPYFGLYCASKWAMEAWCEALHYELEPFGIESLLVEPSGHGTNLVSASPAPADDAAVGGYGDMALGRDRLLGMFQGMFDQGDSVTDAGNVARAIAGLIAAPSPRPIRTQVGEDMGVSAVNAATAPIQAALVDMLRPIYRGEAA